MNIIIFLVNETLDASTVYLLSRTYCNPFQDVCQYPVCTTNSGKNQQTMKFLRYNITRMRTFIRCYIMSGAISADRNKTEFFFAKVIHRGQWLVELNNCCTAGRILLAQSRLEICPMSCS